MKIKLTVPQHTEKWRISFKGGTPFQRKTAMTAYALIERKVLQLLGTRVKEKMAIVVRYGHGVVNETIASRKVSYLLHALACFLEDYLPASSLKTKERKYAQLS